MSSTLRIKIEYANNGQGDESPLKFVYVIDSPSTTTIDQLIKALQEFFVTQFGCNNMRLIHLVTDDGYLLMKHNICAHVLNNNEKIVCIDMDQFIARNRSTLNFEEAWLTLEQHDASDDIEKSLIIGMNNTGKLYVYLFGGENIKELYMFNILELLDIARDKQKGRILKYTWIHVYADFHDLDVDRLPMKIPVASSSEWFISAQLMHDPMSSNTLFLVGSLKTVDSKNVQSKKLRINLNESTKTIEKGEITDLSAHSKQDESQTIAQTQTRLEELKKTIPPLIRTGPVHDINVSNVKIEKYECDGDSSIRMIQGKDSSIELEQETSGRDGSFRNFITITHIIISKKSVVLPEILNQKRSAPVEKPIAIANVNVQYQWHGGKWLDCEDAKIAITSAEQNDRRKIVTSILNIEPEQLISVSIHAAIRVKGNPNRDRFTRARAHRSLPQPLKLKIIFTDSQSKICSLIVEQINDPLKFITKEIFLKRYENDVNELLAFVYADDCEYDERIYIAVYIDTKYNRLAIRDDSKYVHMDKAYIRTAQFNAKKEGKIEQLVEFMHTSDKKVTSLFDSETFLLYAIRIELTTTTSKTVETVLLPLNAIK